MVYLYINKVGVFGVPPEKQLFWPERGVTLAAAERINRQNRQIGPAYQGQCALSTTLPGDSLNSAPRRIGPRSVSPCALVVATHPSTLIGPWRSERPLKPPSHITEPPSLAGLRSDDFRGSHVRMSVMAHNDLSVWIEEGLIELHHACWNWNHSAPYRRECKDITSPSEIYTGLPGVLLSGSHV
jgi:hypothetical protein